MKTFDVISAVPISKRDPAVETVDSAVNGSIREALQAIGGAETPDPSWRSWNDQIIGEKVRERVTSVRRYQQDKLTRFVAELQAKLVETRRARTKSLYPLFYGITSEERSDGRYYDDRAYRFSVSSYSAKLLRDEYERAISSDMIDYASRLVDWCWLNPSRQDKPEDYFAVMRAIEGAHKERLKIEDGLALEHAIIRGITNLQKFLESLTEQ